MLVAWLLFGSPAFFPSFSSLIGTMRSPAESDFGSLMSVRSSTSMRAFCPLTTAGSRTATFLTSGT